MLSISQYVVYHGKFCPNCEAEESVRGDDLYIEEGTVVHEVHCVDCQAYWTDIYSLSGYRELTVEDD